MKKLFTALMFASGILVLQSCGENKKTDVVESGTYQGVAEEVEADEKEIYVRTPDDKLLELYFTDSTKLTKAGSVVPFDALKEKGKVEVQVEKKGNKLVPVAVSILD
ncbi:hypothetical protein [Pedobacter frigoris]|uniref:hypothetical protein n=1 Tax=Pedobacter frigoris TaxID=2571272 RepID=UPI00292F25CE|nr:hypothetical protein [Pedobacter frigoris]